MKIEDIEWGNEEKVENIEDFIEYCSWWGYVEYRWFEDDGDESLMLWLDFPALELFTKLFSPSTIDECEADFQCLFRHDCIVFPHFEWVLEHCDIDERDIKRIFPEDE